jgi:hypothetical protein
VTLVQHTTKSVEYYTPTAILDAARNVMGGIDFDPASSDVANTAVRAKHYLTASCDGLVAPWRGPRVWCNPPGGKLGKPLCTFYGTTSLAAAFWVRLMAEVEEGTVTEACFFAFNIETLRATQRLSCHAMLDHTICYPASRLRFWGEGVGASGPCASAIAYVGPNVEAFGREFAPFGKVVHSRG